MLRFLHAAASGIMQHHKNMDVVICGGGVIGTCTAYFLAKRGVYSIVLEKDELANAASGKAGGFLARDWSSGSALNILSAASFDLHAELAAELDGENQYGYRRLKSHSITLRNGAPYDKPCHETLPQWLDGSMVHGPAMQIGSKETNAQLHPYQFCRTLHAKCSNMGVEFLTQRAVTNISYSKDNKLKTITINGNKELSADTLVLAMGPWTGIAKNWFPTLTDSIYGQKAHSITVIPKSPLTAEAIFASYGDLSPDIYPRPDGEAYICGVAEAPQQSSKLDSPGTVTPTNNSCKTLKELAAEMSTSLRDGKIGVEQACYLPLTQDGLPIIGRVPKYDGVYVAAGHSCWGILNAPITGKVMSELIIDSATSVNLAAFSPDRFAE